MRCLHLSLNKKTVAGVYCELVPYVKRGGRHKETPGQVLTGVCSFRDLQRGGVGSNWQDAFDREVEGTPLCSMVCCVCVDVES